MKSVLSLLLICAAASIAWAKSDEPFAPTFVVPEVDDAYYDQALEILKLEDPGTLDEVDFLKFRFAYLKIRDKRDLSVPVELEQQYHQELNKDEPDADRIIELCNEILALDYTDLNRHVIRNYFLQSKGEDVSFFQEVATRLIDSIFRSGDGRSPETALHVSQVKEEYEILKMYRLKKTTQRLLTIGDHSFDLIECQDSEGEVFEIWFDVTEHMKAIRAMFAE